MGYRLKLNIHVIADLLLLENTPTTLQIEAAQIAGVHDLEKSSIDS